MRGTRDIVERQLVEWGFRLRRADRMRRAAIRQELTRGPFLGGFDAGISDHDQETIRGFIWPAMRRDYCAITVPAPAEDFDSVVL